MSEPKTGPDLRELFLLFRSPEDVPLYEVIPADEMPEPYHRLLVHDQHMTVTVEAHHKSLVDVEVLAEHRDDGNYARKILLVTQKDRKVVQYGIMRFNFRYCSIAVHHCRRDRREPHQSRHRARHSCVHVAGAGAGPG